MLSELPEFHFLRLNTNLMDVRKNPGSSYDHEYLFWFSIPAESAADRGSFQVLWDQLAHEANASMATTAEYTAALDSVLYDMFLVEVQNPLTVRRNGPTGPSCCAH